MIAYTRHLEQTCQGCGEWLVESTDPRNEGRYQVGLPSRCHACTAFGIATAPYEKTEHRQALRFSVDLEQQRQDFRYQDRDEYDQADLPQGA